LISPLSYQELLYGTGADPADEVTCTFNEDTDELILVKDIFVLQQFVNTIWCLS